MPIYTTYLQYTTMKGLPHIFLMVLLLNEYKCNILNDTDAILCNLEDDNFWNIYRWHFGNATTITIIQLESYYRYTVREFLSEFLHHLYLHRILTKTFIIKKHAIETVENSYLRIIYDECECRHKNHNNNNTERTQIFGDSRKLHRFQRMKRYSCDPEDAFLLISWNEDELENFINQQQEIFPKPRGSYMIIFVSPIEFNRLKLEHLSRTIWEKIGVLHLIFRRLCSLDKENYIFNPFTRREDHYGQLRNFTLNNGSIDINNYISLMRHLNGYPVNVSLFNRMPTAVKPVNTTIKEDPRYSKVLYKSDWYGGVDGMMLATMAEYLDFMPIINTPPADIEYGYVYDNGTAIGSIGDVINRKVVASFNGRFLKNYKTDDIEFTKPVGNDMLCLVVPSAQKIPQWMNIFRCFTVWAWLGLFGLYALMSAYWYGLKSINLVEKPSRIKKNWFVLLEIYAFYVSQGVDFPRMDSHRVFFASCMMFNIIISGTFQSSLVTSFTTEQYYQNVDNLPEFDNTGMKIGTSSASLSDSFVLGENSLHRSIKNKIDVVPGVSMMERTAYKKDIASIERYADAILRIKIQFTKPEIGKLLHLVNDCPRSYYISYIVSKGSPYLRVFNHVITKFIEAGLVVKWGKDIVNAYVPRDSRGEKNINTSGGSSKKVFTLYDIQTAFYLLIFGLMLSSVVFLVEVGSKKKKINPNRL